MAKKKSTRTPKTQAGPPERENRYLLPPDLVMEQSTTPFAEVIDWAQQAYGLPELWKRGRGLIGSGAAAQKVKVCVLDTGIDLDHPDLAAAIGDAADFTRSASGPQDRHGHGSHCAGTIGAVGGNNTGIIGMADCEIYAAKVLGDNGSGGDRSIFAGLDWGLKKGCQFFSLSLGGPQMSTWLRDMFKEVARRPKTFIFAAAGNDAGPVNYPAKWRECIGVGSVDKQGRLSQFTSRGPELAILGPGEDILSCGADGNYLTMSGTSMATPFVVGVAILAFAAHENGHGEGQLVTVDDMRAALQKTASRKVQEGYGLIDPSALLGKMAAEPPPKPDEPEEDFITIRLPRKYLVT